jgi:hypothetical protein
MRFMTAATLAVALLATSCATQYGRQGLGGGYTDEKVDETHYRVKFHGNGYASSDRVWAFWIYRCAELTKEKGYTHFSLRKSGEPLARGDEAMPARAGLRTAAYREGEGAPAMLKTKGGSAPVYVYTPGSTITTYHTDAVVGLHREPLPEGVVVLKAQAVLDELAAYVKSNGEATLIARDELFNKAATLVRPQIGYGFGGPL